MLRIFLLFPILLIAQLRDGPGKASFMSNNLDIFAVQKIDKVHNGGYLDNVGGKYYLNKKWNKCLIKSKDNKSFSLPCNYNLYTDQFEMKFENDLYFLRDENVSSINQLGSNYHPINKAQSFNDDYSIYYEVLSSGENVKLVKRFKLKLSSTQSTTSLGTFEQKITIKEKLFLIFIRDNGKLIEVPKSKGKLFEILNLDKTMIKDLKRINIRNTDTLSKLIKNI